MLRMREEEPLRLGATVLLRDTQVPAERCTATRQLRQLTLQYPGPPENAEFGSIHGLRFPGARHACHTVLERSIETPGRASAPDTLLAIHSATMTAQPSFSG